MGRCLRSAILCTRKVSGEIFSRKVCLSIREDCFHHYTHTYTTKYLTCHRRIPRSRFQISSFETQRCRSINSTIVVRVSTYTESMLLTLTAFSRSNDCFHAL